VTRAELMQRIAGWIGDILESEPPALDDDTDLVRDLGLDSLALAELAAKSRTALKIKVRPAELAADLRVGKLVDLLLARLPPAS
jgi:acyl carrier protein